MEKQTLIKRLKDFILSLTEDKKIEMKSFTLEDGTIVAYDNLDVASPIFKIVDDQQVPLEDGEYIIEGQTIKVMGGLISEVLPIEEKKEEVSIEAEKEKPEEKPEDSTLKMKAEYDEKIEALKTEHKLEMAKQKEVFKEKLEEFAKEVESIKVIQAPIEVKKPKKVYTAADYIMKDLGIE
jgi:hypothetical protein